MVTMGDTPVDEVNGVGIPRHIKLIDQNVNLLAELAYAIKKNGAVASFELNHPGNTARNPDGGPPGGPDGFVRPDGCTVLEMDEDMIATRWSATPRPPLSSSGRDGICASYTAPMAGCWPVPVPGL